MGTKKEKKQTIKGKRINVGGLGEVVISKKYGFINVYFIKECGEVTRSWQLLVDENRGDIILKTAKVFPLDKETIELALDEPQAFGLTPEDKEDRIIYDKLNEVLKGLK